MNAMSRHPRSDVDPGGEGGHEAFVRLTGTDDPTRLLPFGGRMHAGWFLVAALLMYIFLIYVALAPLNG